MTERIAVIGAGMGGLGAAHELSKHGLPLTIFERSSQPGGRMTTAYFDGFHLDYGASFIISYFKAIRNLARELGMAGELNKLDRHAAALFRDGKLHVAKFSSALSALRFTGLSWKGKLAMMGTLPESLRHHSKVRKFFDPYKALTLDEGDAYSWVVRKAGQEVADYFADAACQSVTMYRLTELSRANFMVFGQIGNDLNLYAFRKGMLSIPRKLAENKTVHYQRAVKRVEQKGDRVEVTWTEEDREYTDVFGAAVVAVWGDVVPDIVQGLTPLEREVFAATQYSTTYPVALTLSRPIDDPFYGVWIPPKESEILASLAVEDAKVSGGIPEGKGLLFCLTNERWTRSFKGSREEAGEIVAKEAFRIMPHLKDSLESIKVFKWDRAVEKYPPGTLRLLSGISARRPLNRRIFYAGSYLLAPCTDAAFTSGIQAAEELMKVLELL